MFSLQRQSQRSVPILKVGILGIALLIAACSDDKKVEAPEAMNITMTSSPEGSLFVTLGRTSLRIPPERKPTSVHGSMLSWHLLWPELKPATGRDYSRIILVSVSRLSNSAELFRRNNPDGGIDDWVHRLELEGPFQNAELGLVEYRRRTDPRIAVLYHLPGNSSVPPTNGERPYVKCAMSASKHQWDGRRRCEARWLLTPDVEVRYQMSEALLPEWPAIDAAIRAFIDGMLSS